MAEPTGKESTVLLSWSARKIQPVVVVQVILVFLAFILMAHFLFHSREAIIALAAAAVGSLVPLLPGVMTRTEFRLTDRGLESASPGKEGRGEPRELFTWDELSHLVPGKDGFKFYKSFEASGWWDRFRKNHISDRWSGEFQVEKEDRPRVAELLQERAIPMARPEKLP